MIGAGLGGSGQGRAALTAALTTGADAGRRGSARGTRGVAVGESLVGGGKRGRRGLVRPLRDSYEQAVDDEELARPGGHRGRSQLALAGGGGGQDVVGVRGDLAVRAAGDRDGRRAVVEGDPQRLYDVGGAPGVGDGDGDIAGPQLHGVRHGEVRVGVRMRDQADAQQLLGEVLADEVGRPDAVDVDAAGGGERGRRRLRAG